MKELIDNSKANIVLDIYDNYSYDVDIPVNKTLKIPGQVLPNEPYTLFQAMVKPYSSENACVIITHLTKKAYNFYEYFKYLNPTNSIGETQPKMLKPEDSLFTDSQNIADQINNSRELQNKDISQISEISIENNKITITMRKKTLWRRTNNGTNKKQNTQTLCET
jgi:uncharacterized protein YdbL (DUF1318 family)